MVNRKRKDDTKAAAPKPKSSRGNNGNARAPSPVRVIERITPVKSPNDGNEYRVIRLSNGLTAALISRRGPNGGQRPNMKAGLQLIPEPSMEKLALHFLPPSSYLQEPPRITDGMEELLCCDANDGVPRARPSCTSVAMVISVGGINDPVNCQGLNHFTEHMVHHGSEKFPQEDTIDMLIGNFGYRNASTFKHTTRYFNDVPDELLEKNLELFSEMLTRPLFTLDCLKREVNSVDSEFHWRLRFPYWHLNLLIPHVAIKSKDHPLKKFLLGNIKTISDCRNQNGDRVQGLMRKNHEEVYVASAMTFAISSSKPIEELEALTLHHFSELLQGTRQPLHNLDAPSEQLILQNTFSQNQHIYLQGDSSEAQLALSWILPASLWVDDTDEKVTETIEAMMSDTSASSLDAYLRGVGWVWGTRVYWDNTYYAAEFSMIMGLTELGQANIDRIMDATFSFISTLRDRTSEQDMGRFFHELKISNLRAFHYGSQDCSMQFTEDCALRLQYSDTLADVVAAESWANATFNHGRIIDALKLFDPSRMIKIEVIPKHKTLAEIQTREKCKVSIQTCPFSRDSFIILTKKPSSRKSMDQCQFKLPPVNCFLKDEYTRNCGNSGGAGDSGDWHLLRPANHGDIGFQALSWKSKSDACGNGDGNPPKIAGIHIGHHSEGFDPYRAFVILSFISIFTLDLNSRAQSLTWLWAEIISNKVYRRASEFDMGGYHVRIFPGISIMVTGYPKHLDQVVEAAIREMFDTEITQAEFNMAKERLGLLRERYMSNNHYLTSSLLYSILEPQPCLDFLGDVENLTFDDLSNAIIAFKLTAYCRVILVGNIPITGFEKLATSLDTREFGPRLGNKYSVMASLPYALSQPGILIPGESCVRVKSLVSTGFTTSVTNLYIIGKYEQGSQSALCFDTAMSFLHCKAFTQLRTQEQLGYVVYARRILNLKMSTPVMAFFVSVTSTASKLTACELNDKIDLLLARYGDSLKDLNCAVFDMMKRKIEAPHELTKEQVGDWFNSRFGHEFAQRDHLFKCAIKGIRKVSLQVLTTNPKANVKPCDCAKCSSISRWKREACQKSTPMVEFAEAGAGEYREYFV